MAKTWCLIQSKADAFRKAIKDGTINPFEMEKMTSAERQELLAGIVGEENAQQVNANFESKLLLKNKVSGYKTWVKKIGNITPQVRRDLYAKIDNLTEVMSKTDEKIFLNDLIATRLKVKITQSEANEIARLNNEVRDKKSVWESKIKENPLWSENPVKTEKKWKYNEDRLAYGIAKVNLENYFNDLKIESRKIKLSEQPVRKVVSVISEIPGFLKSSLASFDDSFFGRQGIKVLLDPKTSRLWGKNLIKSLGDIGKQLVAKGKIWTSGDNAVIDMIKADIYSRPNSLNGKYDAGNYGLSVFNEEAYPSSIPEKIPLFGRIFKASEVAYNGAALRLRADLADRIIDLAEKNGVNTLSKTEAQPIGRFVSSITGRGSLGKAEVFAKEINVLAFSIKFLKSNIDTLIAPVKYLTQATAQKLGAYQFENTGDKFAKKEAATKTLRIVATLAFILTLAKFLDDDNELDPRSSSFGKVKIFGKKTDVTGGLAGLLSLVSKLVPTKHDGKWGFWKKDTKGDYVSLTEGGFGKQNAMDVFDSFWQGKLSPIAGILRDLWKGETYGGEEANLYNLITGATIPLPLQDAGDILKDPSATFPLGSIILSQFGFTVSSYPENNEKTKLIPTGTKIKSDDFMSMVAIYAKAMGTDPETAFNRIFTGQKIIQVSDGGIIVVARQDVSDSQAFKKQWVKENGGDVSKMKEVKLDHTIPNKLGGEEKPSNWKIVPNAVWASYTKTENALIQAVKDGNISLKEAQAEIVKFKSIQDNTARKKYGEDLINRVKSKVKSSKLVKPAYAADGEPGMESVVDQHELWGADAPVGTVTYYNKSGEATLLDLKSFTPGKHPDLDKNYAKMTSRVVKEKANLIGKIVKIADEYKVDPSLMIDLAWSENTLKADVKGNGIEGNTATGFYQFLEGTWKDEILKKYAKKIGIPTNASRLDLEANMRAAAWAIKNGKLSWWADKHNRRKFLDQYPEELRSEYGLNY